MLLGFGVRVALLRFRDQRRSLFRAELHDVERGCKTRPYLRVTSPIEAEM